MSTDQQRAAANYLNETYGVSERRTSRVMGRSRSVLRYSRRHKDDELSTERSNGWPAGIHVLDNE